MAAPEESSHSSTALSEVVDNIVDKIKSLPAAQDSTAESDPPPTPHSPKTFVKPKQPRMFGRDKSIYDLLGGSRVADIVLWRNPNLSAGILGATTFVYIIFEWLGCHVISVLSIVLLLTFGTLFVWSNAAAVLKRSPPPVPRVQVSENTAINAAAVVKDETNRIIGMLYEVVLGKDIKLFVKTEAALWMLALIGKWVDFLTLVYLGVLLVLTVPYLYEKHEDQVEHTLKIGYEHTKVLHKKFCEQVWSKMPHLQQKEKKVQ